MVMGEANETAILGLALLRTKQRCKHWTGLFLLFAATVPQSKECLHYYSCHLPEGPILNGNWLWLLRCLIEWNGGLLKSRKKKTGSLYTLSCQIRWVIKDIREKILPRLLRLDFTDDSLDPVWQFVTGTFSTVDCRAVTRLVLLTTDFKDSIFRILLTKG